MIFFAAVAMVATTPVAATAAANVAEPNPKTMSRSEIKAFNATLERDHRYYIRCKRNVATGSLMAREFSCRTNEQWTLADARGNQEARDIMDDMTSKGASTSN